MEVASDTWRIPFEFWSPVVTACFGLCISPSAVPGEYLYREKKLAKDVGSGRRCLGLVMYLADS